MVIVVVVVRSVLVPDLIIIIINYNISIIIVTEIVIKIIIITVTVIALVVERMVATVCDVWTLIELNI
jgi:hypothetical protein